MKTFITRHLLSIALLLVSCAAAVAQSPNPQSPSWQVRAHRESYAIKKKLQLDEPTHQQVLQINININREIDSVQKSTMGYELKLRHTAHLQKERDQELKKVLTKEQFDLYEAERQGIKNRSATRRQGRHDASSSN